MHRKQPAANPEADRFDPRAFPDKQVPSNQCRSVDIKVKQRYYVHKPSVSGMSTVAKLPDSVNSACNISSNV